MDDDRDYEHLSLGRLSQLAKRGDQEAARRLRSLEALARRVAEDGCSRPPLAVTTRLEANSGRMAQQARAARERAAIQRQEAMVRELATLREEAQAQRTAREAADRKARRWQIGSVVVAFLGVVATVLVAVLGG